MTSVNNTNPTTPTAPTPKAKGNKRTNNAPTPAEIAANAPKPETAIDAIKTALKGAFDEFAPDQFLRDEAQEALKRASDVAGTTRERIMIRMADLAEVQGWPADKIEDAAKAAVIEWSKARNDKAPTTLAQFAVELRRAMHPKARAHVKQVIEDATVAWDDERDDSDAYKAAVKEAKASGSDKPEPIEEPLLKTFAKRYHLVAGSKGMLQAYIDGIKDADDPMALAGVRNKAQRTDPKAAAKAIQRMLDVILPIAEEFPCEEVRDLLADAKAITEKTLADAKAKFAIAAEREKRRAERAARGEAPPERRLTRAERRAAAAAAGDEGDLGDAVDELGNV